MDKRIWTFDKAVMLYRLLVLYFGPYKDWELTTYPKRDPKDREQYEKFCDDMARLFGAKSGEAIKNQVAWATTEQTSIEGGYIETWYRNSVAAKEAGFIGTELLPKTILCEY